jgi:hypothetical protein
VNQFSFTNLITGSTKPQKQGNADRSCVPSVSRQGKAGDLSFNRYFNEIAQRMPSSSVPKEPASKSHAAKRATPDRAMICERLPTSPLPQVCTVVSRRGSSEEVEGSPRSFNLDRDVQEALQQAELSYELDSRHLEKSHPSITWLMRATLVEWMMEVCRDFMLKRETFHYSVCYVDRFMTLTKSLKREEYQLVGLVAMFVACKMEEVVPQSIKSFAASAQFGYSEEQIQQLELRMCQVASNFGNHNSNRFSNGN